MATSVDRTSNPANEDYRLGSIASRVSVFGIAVGIAGMLAAAYLGQRVGDEWKTFLHSYLTNFTFFLSIALGALFFVILHHITRAGWSVVVRRLAEVISTNLLLMLFLSIPVILGMHELYHWTHAEAVAGDPVLEGKAVWLNQPFFIVRLAVYFTVWIGLSLFFQSTSVAQDSSGDPALSLRMQKVSPAALILFALTTTFAGFDLLMSLDPHWFSTMFGVYFFSGGVMAFFATAILAAYLSQVAGKLRTAISIEHFHDLGKLMFAFTCFWGYVAFSQYMLIWYANMPEETEWFQHRHQGAWGIAGVCFLIFGHFIAPFVLIMSRNVKRLPAAIALAAAWMLGVHWFDHYWLVMPTYNPDAIPFGALDIALFVGMGGLFVAQASMRLIRTPAVPVRDPRLAESLAFENF